MNQLGAEEVAEHRNWCLVVDAEDKELIGQDFPASDMNRMLERFVHTFAEPTDQTQLHLCFAEDGNCNNRCIN